MLILEISACLHSRMDLSVGAVAGTLSQRRAFTCNKQSVSVMQTGFLDEGVEMSS